MALSNDLSSQTANDRRMINETAGDLARIEDLIEDIRQGKMVILMDDEDRENEGDIIMAAEKVEAEHINFMARHARGLICLPMTRERCERLSCR